MTENPNKIGERALQMMDVVKDLEVFKVPKVPEKKKKKSFKILDEDSYIQNMSKIIERDFFPDLEKLNAQNEYLEAEQNKDIEKMRQLYMKYSSGRTPSERFSGSSAIPSPATFETPVDVRREESEPLNINSPSSSIRSESSEIPRKNTPKQPFSFIPKDTKQGLDEYLSTHTSEDNASFSEIMEKSITHHRNKHSWQYKDESDSEKDREERLALPQTVEEQMKILEQPRPLSVDTWTYKNKNFIMFVPDGVQRTPEEEVNLAKQRQEIKHSNTRFIKSPFDERENQEQIKQIAQSQAHTLDGKIGVDGKELNNHPDMPSVNGFSFVPTPSPKPGVCESPIMTWGEIEGTPFRLDGLDTPRVQHGASILAGGPSFRIAEPAKRERLAHALADKAAIQRNSKQGNTTPLRKLLRTPTPSNTFDRLETMSPAARKLATSKIRSLGSDRGLRASYSPSPIRRSEERVPFSPRKGLINGLTPSLISASEKEKNSIISQSPKLPSAINNTISNDLTPTNSDNVTTDNLLNLPTRAKAVDFF